MTFATKSAYVCLFLPLFCGILPSAFCGPVQQVEPLHWFAGREVGIKISIAPTASPHLFWRLQHDSQTLQQGTLNRSNGTPSLLTIPAPQARPGVVHQLQLEFQSEQNGEIVMDTFPIRVFHEDPFAARRQQLKDWPLHLYDPLNHTRSWLDAAKVPYESVQNPEDVKNGILLVGEGLSLFDRPQIIPSLQALVTSGIPVICLALQEGRSELLNVAPAPPPSAWRFEDETLPSQLRKDLTAVHFPVYPISLQPFRGHLMCVFGEDLPGWPWMELRYPGNTPLIFCGFQLLPDAERSPASIYLLDALFTHVRNIKNPNGETP